MLPLSLPATYALELTAACNNRCPGCSNVYATGRARPQLPAEWWVQLLAEIAPTAAHIRLTGGEPTLHPGFFDILHAATSYEAMVSVFTNGRWPDGERFLARLHELPRPARLVISLHGARAETHEAFTATPGSFAETVANIRRAVESGTEVLISTVITHHNWRELAAVAELGRKLGVESVTFNRYLGPPLPGIEPGEDELLAAVQVASQLTRSGISAAPGNVIPQCFVENSTQGCHAGVSYVAIDPWGNVRPCTFSPTIIGSLQKSSMYELWHSAEMDAWRELMPKECITCAAYSICHGGCRALIELRPDRRDPLRKEPLSNLSTPPRVYRLPANARPHLVARIRPEPFGYALLGGGHVLPVTSEARPILEACDGERTFAELHALFGDPALELLGELWSLGMIETP